MLELFYFSCLNSIYLLLRIKIQTALEVNMRSSGVIPIFFLVAVYLFPVFSDVEGTLNIYEYLGMTGHHRVKRIVDRPPRPKTTEHPLTSEEMRERMSGTESPHLHDYPDAIYKNEEMRKGEWSGNPIAKSKTEEVEKKEADTTKPKKSSKSRSAGTLSSLAGRMGGL